MSTTKTVLLILGSIFGILALVTAGLALITFGVMPFIGTVLKGFFDIFALPFTLMI